ncbi:hypothetical protein ABU162_24515 [Paenibacillus thiaminolyticus]|uniref:hypothetical protein n=1 Tax=Paenibacillus thiaminolyticus TaxID=49283 RepID=UPI0035A607CE
MTGTIVYRGASQPGIPVFLYHIQVAKLRNNAGLGIIGMRERAGTCGGTFQLESVPRKGTVIRVQLPCGKEGEEA